jgi:hypothetical protein
MQGKKGSHFNLLTKIWLTSIKKWKRCHKPQMIKWNSFYQTQLQFQKMMINSFQAVVLFVEIWHTIICFAQNVKQPWCADLVKIYGRWKMKDNSTVRIVDLLSNQEIPARSNNNSWKIFRSLARLLNVKWEINQCLYQNTKNINVLIFTDLKNVHRNVGYL